MQKTKKQMNYESETEFELTKDEENTESYAFPVLTGDYFEQIEPGIIAEIFAPGIISLKNRLQSQVAFSPDGKSVYFQIYSANYVSTIYYTKRKDGIWTEPVEAPFAIDKNIQLSSISPDGHFIFLNSNRRDGNIFKVEIIGSEWSELELLPIPINSNAGDSSYQELEDGTGYLCSKREGSNSKDLWFINVLPNGEKEAENLGNVVNSENMDFSPLISSDGSFMIFGSDRFGRRGLAHLYISFIDKDGLWTEPVDLNVSGAEINDNQANQSCPALSPDGSYLFFMRHYDITTMNVYWASTSFIDDIRKIVFSENKEE
ncbi:MAG: PD40 domain-containing protein [Tenericutes bacterium]|nr:PD40 domain-containing protein [Mycoplasmatota bacterium]